MQQQEEEQRQEKIPRQLWCAKLRANNHKTMFVGLIKAKVVWNRDQPLLLSARGQVWETKM